MAYDRGYREGMDAGHLNGVNETARRYQGSAERAASLASACDRDGHAYSLADDPNSPLVRLRKFLWCSKCGGTKALEAPGSDAKVPFRPGAVRYANAPTAVENDVGHPVMSNRPYQPGSVPEKSDGPQP